MNPSISLNPLSASISGLLSRGMPIANDTDRSIIAGMARIERLRRIDQAAAPMRELFAQLAAGEVYLIDGAPSMRLPELDPIAGVTDDTEWVPIAPAIRGWVDYCKRLFPKLNLQRMTYLADRLDQHKELTPRLVEQAHTEFEQSITRMRDLPVGAITSAITTTQIGWEMERLIGRPA